MVTTHHKTYTSSAALYDLDAPLRKALLRLARKHRPILVNLEDPDLVRLALAATTAPVA